jgi:predicted MFS family arabinose efflux permease
MIRSPAALVALYRDAFGGLPRLTWLLCVAAFLNRCGAMVVPFLGLYAKDEFGYSPAEAGVLLSLYGAGAFTGSWLGGVLTDRLGPVRLQILALGATGFWMLSMTQVLWPGWLEASVFVLAVLNEAFRPGSITAVATSCAPHLRRKALALNRLMLNLGWAFGPTIGGYLVAVDFRLMFVVDGATCGLAALFLATCLSGYDPRPVPRAAGERPGRPFRDRHFVWLMAANVIVLLAFMQYFTTGTRVFEDQGFGTETIGWMLAVNPIMIVAFEMLVVHLLGERRALPIVGAGAFVVGLGYLLLLPSWGGAGIVVAMAVVAGGELLQMPLLGAYVNDHAPANARGAYNGAHGMTFSVGQILAPLIGGLLYDRAGAAALWWACGGLAALAALMFWWAERIVPAAPPPDQPPKTSASDDASSNRMAQPSS